MTQLCIALQNVVYIMIHHRYWLLDLCWPLRFLLCSSSAFRRYSQSRWMYPWWQPHRCMLFILLLMACCLWINLYRWTCWSGPCRCLSLLFCPWRSLLCTDTILWWGLLHHRINFYWTCRYKIHFCSTGKFHLRVSRHWQSSPHRKKLSYISILLFLEEDRQPSIPCKKVWEWSAHHSH